VLLAIAIAAAIGPTSIRSYHVFGAKAMTGFQAIVGRIVQVTNLASGQYLQHHLRNNLEILIARCP
jgi:hypothetical protein